MSGTGSRLPAPGTRPARRSSLGILYLVLAMSTGLLLVVENLSPPAEPTGPVRPTSGFWLAVGLTALGGTMLASPFALAAALAGYLRPRWAFASPAALAIAYACVYVLGGGPRPPQETTRWRVLAAAAVLTIVAVGGLGAHLRATRGRSRSVSTFGAASKSLAAGRTRADATKRGAEWRRPTPPAQPAGLRGLPGLAAAFGGMGLLGSLLVYAEPMAFFLLPFTVLGLLIGVAALLQSRGTAGWTGVGLSLLGFLSVSIFVQLQPTHGGPEWKPRAEMSTLMSAQLSFSSWLGADAYAAELRCLVNPRECLPDLPAPVPSLLSGDLLQERGPGYTRRFIPGAITEAHGSFPLTTRFAYLLVPGPHLDAPALCGGCDEDACQVCEVPSGNTPRVENGRCVVDEGSPPGWLAAALGLGDADACYLERQAGR
jgi:hypothetical protein